MELLLDIGWKAIATAFAIVLIAKAGERVGALMASVVMTLPMNAGPGFFFVALTQPASFIRESALISFSATGAMLAFVAVYVWSARFGGLFVRIGFGLLGWLALASTTILLPHALWSAVATIAFGIILVILLKPTQHLSAQTTLVRSTWHYLAGRALVCAVIIATVAQFASTLGPIVAGLVFAFPITIIGSVWVLHRRYGGEFALAIMARVPAGLPTLSGFCLALYLAADVLPPVAAWGVAVMASFAIASARALWSGRNLAHVPGTASSHSG